MIIDSHAHYAHSSFENSFQYLSWEDNWTLKEGTLEDLLNRMEEQGVAMSVEPGISLDSNEKILQLAQRYPGQIFPAVGCHPTRCIYEKWSDRKRLDKYAVRSGILALGETGLDYHPRVVGEIAALQGRPREEVERLTAENAIRLYRLPGWESLK